MAKDDIFLDRDRHRAGGFVFDQRVAAVFDDMVSRSVPGYSTIQLLVADLACRFEAGGAVYDLGCSTGETCRSILARAGRPVRIVGIDNSADMLKQARAKTGDSVLYRQADFTKDDVFSDQDRITVVILCLSLQFVRPIDRPSILARAFNATHPGGALIFVEKTIEADPELNSLYIDYYHSFKAEMGYSALEISSKREALENVLIPFRRDENIKLLRDAGYRTVSSFFQWFNFSGFLALK